MSASGNASLNSGHSDDGLGTLVRLPGEVRGMVWRLILHPHSPARDREALLVSRAVNVELNAEAFRDRTMNLGLRQQPLHEFRPPSRFMLFDRQHVLTFMGPKWFTFDMWRDGLDLWKMAHLPFGRHSFVKFSIPPVDREDPGQLAICYNKMVFIVNLLMFARWLPTIQIHFLGDASDWAGPQGLHRSLPGFGTKRLGDLEMLLLPIRRLRRVQEVVINMPEHCRQLVRALVDDITAQGALTDRFDTRREGDRWVMQLEWAASTWVDYQINDLPGPTASRVRWESHRCLTPDYYRCARIRMHHSRTFFTEAQQAAMRRALDQRVQCVVGFVFLNGTQEGALDYHYFPDPTPLWQGVNLRHGPEGALVDLPDATAAGVRNLFGYALPAQAAQPGPDQGIHSINDVPRCSSAYYQLRFMLKYPPVSPEDPSDVLEMARRNREHEAGVNRLRSGRNKRSKIERVLKLIGKTKIGKVNFWKGKSRKEKEKIPEEESNCDLEHSASDIAAIVTPLAACT